MSLVKNIGIGKQVFGFAYELDFYRYKSYGFFSVDAETILKRWNKIELTPSIQEAQSAATKRFGNYDLRRVDYRLHFQDGAVMMSATLRQLEDVGGKSEFIPNFISCLEVYKDHIAIARSWKDYKDRLISMGIYKEIETKNGYFILELNESR